MANPKFTDEQITAIQIDLNSGLHLSKIARLYGTSRQVIQHIARRNTYAHVNPEWRYQPLKRDLDDRMLKRMWRLWCAGYTPSEISTLTGFSEYTVKRYMKEMEKAS